MLFNMAVCGALRQRQIAFGLLESYVFSLERAVGIEPTSEAWKASILPLYDARPLHYTVPFVNRVSKVQKRSASVDKISTMELTAGRLEGFPSQDVSRCYAILVNHVQSKVLWGTCRTRV